MANQIFNSLLGSGMDVPHQMAAAWLVAAGLDGDATETAAINTFVDDVQAVSAGLWDKFYAIYPMRGSSLANSVYNLVDPDDADAAYRMSISGTPTLGATGITFSDASDIMNTHFIGDTTCAAAPYLGIGWYQQAGDYQTFGKLSAGNDRIGIEFAYTPTLMAYIAWQSLSGITCEKVGGHQFIQREIGNPNDTFQYYKPDGTAGGSATIATNPYPGSGGGTEFDWRGNATNSTTLSMTWITQELTAAEVLGLRNAIQTYLTTLGLEV